MESQFGSDLADGDVRPGGGFQDELAAPDFGDKIAHRAIKAIGVIVQHQGLQNPGDKDLKRCGHKREFKRRHTGAVGSKSTNSDADLSQHDRGPNENSQEMIVS